MRAGESRPAGEATHRGEEEDVAVVDAPSGPSMEEEAAFLAQEREMGIVTPSLMHVEAPPMEEKEGLPPMEDLVKRIPLATRDLIEQLFRARFVTVKRIPESALK